jgi:hypothetical protein
MSLLLNTNLPYSGMNWRNPAPVEWSKFQSSMQSTASSTTSSDSKANGSTFLNSFNSCCILSNGNLFIMPNVSVETTGYIYNPYLETIVNTFTVPSGYNTAGFLEFCIPVLMQDGRVFLPPNGNGLNRAYIYNPFTNTIATTGTGFNSSSPYKATLMLDGRIYCHIGTITGSTTRIFNPFTNTTIFPNPSGTVTGVSVNRPTVLPDGKLIITSQPRSSATTIPIYNPSTNVMSTISGTFASTEGYARGVILPNGLTFFFALTGTAPSLLFNYTTNTFSTTGTLGVSLPSNPFSCVLLPNGNVFISQISGSAGSANTAYIYNTSSGTFSTSSITTSSQTFNMLFDGRIFMKSNSASVAEFYGGNKGFDYNVTLSPFTSRW